MITDAFRRWAHRIGQDRAEARLMKALDRARASDLRDLGIARDQVDVYLGTDKGRKPRQDGIAA